MSKGVDVNLYICHNSYDAQINVKNIQITFSTKPVLIFCY